MKYLMSLVILSFLFLPSGFSQVKKKYVDSKNTATTVVVKDKAADDYQILNQQFDINSVGLGEVIMIKTENLTAKSGAEIPAQKVTKKAAPETTAAPKVRKKPTEIYYKGIGTSTKKNLKRKKTRKRLKKRKFKKRRRLKRKVGCPTF